MSIERGSIPSKFPIEACFDGKTLSLRNNFAFVLSVKTKGDIGHLSRTEKNYSLAALATRHHSNDPYILLPVDTLGISIGKGAAAALLTGSKSAGFYALATTAENFFPGRTSAVINAFTDFVQEIDDDFTQYSNCLVHKNWLGQLGCKALLTRNVTYATGRGVATGATKGLPNVLLSAATFAHWVDVQPGQIASLRKAPPISLRAAPERKTPVQPAAAPRHQQSTSVPTTPTPPPSPTLTVGAPFEDECVVAWPTAPVRTQDSIEMTMSCQHVPEDKFLFTAVIYGEPNLRIHPDTTALVQGQVVDIAESDHGYNELVVLANSVTLHR